MYCDTPQVNQLTALLLAHGIGQVVVCPGSRNAPLVHNFHQLTLAGAVTAEGEPFRIHSVTDERSAAFIALGLILATDAPAAVCVTSGSALLACLPAVAEAYYRHLPLLVISADRPAEWIGQLDGQTLPQAGALMPYCPTADVAFPHDETARWANNRRINAALLSLRRHGGGPAHINVQITEPFMRFTTPQLPAERVVSEILPQADAPLPAQLISLLKEARLPALVMGQYEHGDLRAVVSQLDREQKLLVLPEIISDAVGSWRMDVLDAEGASAPALVPDVIIQIGGNFIHKRFKQILRQADCRVIRIGEDEAAGDGLPDTFCHLTDIVRTAPLPALTQLCRQLPAGHPGVVKAQADYEEMARQRRAAQDTTAHAADDPLTYDHALTLLNEAIRHSGRTDCSLHLANSTAVRAAARTFPSGNLPVFCNRGVNGIEGSLSTATGYALGMWGPAVCIIGDLSFFYDSNALWCDKLPSNLRIFLVNDGHGGIFDHLSGLSASPAALHYVAAGGRRFSARGLAETFGLDYRSADTAPSLAKALTGWLDDSPQARLLEINI